MAFTYSGNPDTNAVDGVRSLIGDTDSCDPLLQDAEIESFLKKYNNAPLNAAIRCCEIIIAKFSRRPDEVVGNVRISYSQQAKAYRTLLNDLRSRIAIEEAAPYAGGLSKSDKQAQSANTDRVKPDFTKKMMDNREATPFISQSPFDCVPDSESTGG